MKNSENLTNSSVLGVTIFLCRLQQQIRHLLNIHPFFLFFIARKLSLLLILSTIWLNFHPFYHLHRLLFFFWKGKLPFVKCAVFRIWWRGRPLSAILLLLFLLALILFVEKFELFYLKLPPVNGMGLFADYCKETFLYLFHIECQAFKVLRKPFTFIFKHQ